MRFSKRESFPDPSSENVDGLQARLDEIAKEIAKYESDAAGLFANKKNGMMHDGEYNVSVSYIGQRISTLNKEHTDLLNRLDRARSSMARKALGA